MRLAGDGAVAHRAGLEALHDDRDRFDLLDGNRRGGLKLQQAAQRVDILELRVHQRAVFLEGLVIRVADGLLELVDGLRVEEMNLAVRTPLILAADVERVAVDGPVGERALVAGEDFLGDVLDADARDT